MCRRQWTDGSRLSPGMRRVICVSVRSAPDFFTSSQQPAARSGMSALGLRMPASGRAGFPSFPLQDALAHARARQKSIRIKSLRFLGSRRRKQAVTGGRRRLGNYFRHQRWLRDKRGQHMGSRYVQPRHPPGSGRDGRSAKPARRSEHDFPPLRLTGAFEHGVEQLRALLLQIACGIAKHRSPVGAEDQMRAEGRRCGGRTLRAPPS
jgi:hypothetical protein